VKILQLAPRFPFPLIDGGAVGIYKITEGIARLGHEVVFLSYPHEDPEITKKGIEALSQFATVKLVQKPLPNRYKVLLKSLFHGAYPIQRRVSSEMFTLLEKTIEEFKPDLIHVDHSHMAPYVSWIKDRYNLPIVLRQHNYENLIYRRYASVQTNPLKRWTANLHGKRLYKYEVKLLHQVDRVVAISEEDKRLMLADAPGAKFDIIPAGVDTRYFQPSAPELEDPTAITWIGGIDWDPNKDAVLFFLNEIFPKVLAKNPQATFNIIGASTEALRPAASEFGEKVKIFGRVPDIREYLAKSTVLIVPLRIGGGMRLKILDFFAAGKAVVSTSIGAEGNLAKDAVHLLLRDSAEDFAEGVAWFLADRNRRQEFALRARTLVEEKYSWERIAQEFDRVYVSVTQNR